MGYHFSWCIDLLDDLEQNNCLNEPMAQLGNQEFFGDKEEIRKFAMNNNYNNLAKEIIPKNLFEERYGISQYDDFDINGKAKYYLYLTNKLPDFLKEKYYTIMDIGTSEHIFDIANTFKNIYKMCKVGGVVIHDLPLHHWGHGWFNFTERTFRNISIINKFPIIYDGYIYKEPGKKERNFIRQKKEWNLNGGELYYVVAIYKKNRKKFKLPRPLI